MQKGAGRFIDLALILSALAITCLMASLAGCPRPPRVYKDTRVIMGTYVSITAVAEGATDEAARAAVSAAFDEITRVDLLMSTYKPESQLSQVNRMAGMRPVRVDRELIDTVEDALYVSRLTGGAFDPTVGPLVRLWKIGSDEARIPDKEETDSARKLVDYSQVEVNRTRQTIYIRKKGMSIDLGGIAKGYAADRAVAALKARGIRGGIVAVAGDIKLFGSREDGKPWNIGIQHPREKDGLLCTLTLHDAATSSSGDYERYFIKDGVRYHHILDPRTGRPARGLISVTVIARDSWLADGMATGLFVMGPDKGYKLAEGHPEIEVLMVTSDGKILATGRFKDTKIEPVKL
jgi:thiamine biosynthesis lipoprotein